jgi:hypothetical protein
VVKQVVGCCMLAGIFLGFASNRGVYPVAWQVAGPAPGAALPVVQAVNTATPITLDGALDEPVWARAPRYPLSLSKDLLAREVGLQEPGEAQFAWDDQFFYLGVRFYDSDIVAEGAEDQMHHYQLGDLAELFLKAADRPWYWELYVTPRGKKTSFWFADRKHLGEASSFKYTCGLRVAARVKGTLNDRSDRDEYWTGEMAMPVADLTARGGKFGPGSDWRVFVGRYNYNRYLPDKELSMTPALPTTNYHLTEHYAILQFLPPAANSANR